MHGHGWLLYEGERDVVRSAASGGGRGEGDYYSPIRLCGVGSEMAIKTTGWVGRTVWDPGRDRERECVG